MKYTLRYANKKSLTIIGIAGVALLVITLLIGWFWRRPLGITPDNCKVIHTGMSVSQIELLFSKKARKVWSYRDDAVIVYRPV